MSIRVSGGAERLTILRPVDGGGVMRWAPPVYDRVKERYDIEIRGGAENLTLAV